MISPLVNANCFSLALDPVSDRLYIGTEGGISFFDFAKGGQADVDPCVAYVYPNPVLGERGDEELRIENIESPVSVDVYNIEGELVHSGTASQAGDVVWDLTTKEGILVASGVYLVRISVVTSKGESRVCVKTISVIR